MFELRTKFDGGKQINQSQSGSWQHRCMGVGPRRTSMGPTNMGKCVQRTPKYSVCGECQKEGKGSRKRKATDSAKQARRVGKVRRLGNETTKHMPDMMVE